MDPVSACAFALANWPIAPALGEEVPDAACLVYQADFAGRFTRTATDDGGVASAFDLTRSRLETGAQAGRYASMRAAVDTVHTTGDPSGLLVVRPQIVEARLQVPEAGLALFAGAIDNMWTLDANVVFGWRPLANNFPQGVGWLDRSDVGGGLVWTAPEHLLSVDLRGVNGEGLMRPEIDNGKTFQGMLVLRPLALGELPPNTIEVAGYVQRGTRGPLEAPDHRFGARLSGRYEGYGAGFEFLAADGVAGDASQSPYGFAGWATARPAGPAVVVLRVDQFTIEAGSDDSLKVLAAAGAEVPGGRSRGVHLIGGIEQTRIQQATVVRTGSAVFVQLGGLFRGAASLDWAAPPPAP